MKIHKGKCNCPKYSQPEYCGDASEKITLVKKHRHNMKVGSKKHA